MKKLIILLIVVLLICQSSILLACEFPAEEQGLELGAKAVIDDSIPVHRDLHSGAQKTMDVMDIVTAPLIPMSILSGNLFDTFLSVQQVQRLYGKTSAQALKKSAGFSAGDAVFFMELSPKSKNKLNQ